KQLLNRMRLLAASRVRIMPRIIQTKHARDPPGDGGIGIMAVSKGKPAGKSAEREFSKLISDPKDKAPSRAMLRAVGFGDADFKKNMIGVASTWSMVTPCNMHIDVLARESELGVNK